MHGSAAALRRVSVSVSVCVEGEWGRACARATTARREDGNGQRARAFAKKHALAVVRFIHVAQALATIPSRPFGCDQV